MADVSAKLHRHVVQLREVIVEKMTCRRTGDFNSKARPEPQISLRGRTLSKTDAYTYLEFSIGFPEEPKPFHLEVVLRGRLSADDPLSRSALKRFAETNALVLLLPWLREIVASLTRQMGFPPLILPLIDVPQTFRTLAAEEGQ